MKIAQITSLVLLAVCSLSLAGCSTAGGNAESQADAANKNAAAKQDSSSSSPTPATPAPPDQTPARANASPAAPLPVVASPADSVPDAGTAKPAAAQPIAAPAEAISAKKGDEPAATAVSLAVVTRPQFDAHIAAHKGKVIFVDCWATWCDVCLKEFPHTVDLHKKYAKDGLQVISLSMDDTGDHTKALDELMSQGATFLNLRSSYGGSDESFTKYDIPSGLPHMMVFDRTGKLRKSFASDAIDHQEIEKFVQELLSEK